MESAVEKDQREAVAEPDAGLGLVLVIMLVLTVVAALAV